jgi:hypothetical protein
VLLIANSTDLHDTHSTELLVSIPLERNSVDDIPQLIIAGEFSEPVV